MSDENEYFQFLGQTFDVTRAKKIAASGLAEEDVIEVEAWSRYLGEDPGEADAFQINPVGVTVDWNHVDEVDTSCPLIMANFKGRASEGYIIIDGYHRLAKARRNGVETLPVYVLTREQSAEVQL